MDESPKVEKFHSAIDTTLELYKTLRGPMCGNQNNDCATIKHKSLKKFALVRLRVGPAENRNEKEIGHAALSFAKLDVKFGRGVAHETTNTFRSGKLLFLFSSRKI